MLPSNPGSKALSVSKHMWASLDWDQGMLQEGISSSIGSTPEMAMEQHLSLDRLHVNFLIGQTGASQGHLK